MNGSSIVYAGLSGVVGGLAWMVRSRRRGALTFAGGAALVAIGLTLPAREERVTIAQSRLDEYMPAWQFSEHHELRVAATPDRVFAAIREVRADEIALFELLTWIRRGGKEAPESILNAGGNRPLLEVATKSGFIYLADDAPHELVVGTIVVAPKGAREKLTPETFRQARPPGFALAAMNFRVIPDGDGSIVTTDTRVYANSDSARRRFAMYWRAIYPGSALIRRMWLRAIAARS